MKVTMMTMLLSLGSGVTAWLPTISGVATKRMSSTQLQAKQAGTFFNQVPENNDDEESQSVGDDDDDSFESKAAELLRQRKAPSLASRPSTINGKPTAGIGFGKTINPPGDSKPFVGIGPPVNDPTKPEYDDQGFTMYTNEVTGEKSRVFEALVDYPCKFTMKIVGANEGNFVEEMVAVVAESCEVEITEVSHSVRLQGKWSSVTVKAPVKSAEMLYSLYENVDKDPRVKFKF
mmetsp:Transcript_2262/g.4532  ORF Transcript_2262/g.4532 Transcript_2262/m.4532 type:complete len:233 (-) Transcript_2262:85-783(-)